MRVLIFSLFQILQYFLVQGQEMDSANLKIVSDFIECIKHQNKEKLASKISFPLSREYPIPHIKNEQEFIKRYAEIFDESLSKIIVNSQPFKDWSAMGYRGIMLLDGLVWLGYESGNLIAVNYQSQIEEQKWEKLVKTEKNNLHKSIKNFERPICIMESPKYRIRIDDLGDGNYRYCSWPLKSKMNDRPALIIEKGKYIPEGNGGNGRYEFKSGDYTYDCSIIVIGEVDSPPAILTIYKDHKIFFSQKATSLID
jgi:hypothetical protein